MEFNTLNNIDVCMPVWKGLKESRLLNGKVGDASKALDLSYRRYRGLLQCLPDCYDM